LFSDDQAFFVSVACCLQASFSKAGHKGIGETPWE
jgi:hypothetical protein